MPTLEVNGVKLHFEQHGPPDGPPFVLVQGLGIPSTLWYHQLPAFSSRHRVVIFDNRGAGRSDQPVEGYSVPVMARDVVELLDHLGIAKAHVLGLSLGGLIAQEFALGYPDRVAGLILASTHPGGPEYLEETGQMWRERLDVAGMTLEQIYRDALKWGTTSQFFNDETEEVERFIQARLALPQSPAGFQGQFTAGATFDVRDRLADVQAPTLVLHGMKDEVVPRRFGRYIAERIPGARLHLIEQSGHLPFVERPAEFNAAVLQFLADVERKGDGTQ